MSCEQYNGHYIRVDRSHRIISNGLARRGRWKQALGAAQEKLALRRDAWCRHAWLYEQKVDESGALASRTHVEDMEEAINTFIELSDAELDMVSGGQSTVKLTVTNVKATGLTNADVELTGLVATATTTKTSESANLAFNLSVLSA